VRRQLDGIGIAIAGGEGMLQGIKNSVAAATKVYPLKRRAAFALSICISLLLGTISWRFEPAKSIVICASTAACFFDIRGKWFMFFTGIGIGDLLLYALR
jgi:hypothetical protein